MDKPGLSVINKRKRDHKKFLVALSRAEARKAQLDKAAQAKPSPAPRSIRLDRTQGGFLNLCPQAAPSEVCGSPVITAENWIDNGQQIKRKTLLLRAPLFLGRMGKILLRGVGAIAVRGIKRGVQIAKYEKLSFTTGLGVGFALRSLITLQFGVAASLLTAPVSGATIGAFLASVAAAAVVGGIVNVAKVAVQTRASNRNGEAREKNWARDAFIAGLKGGAVGGAVGSFACDVMAHAGIRNPLTGLFQKAAHGISEPLQTTQAGLAGLSPDSSLLSQHASLTGGQSIEALTTAPTTAEAIQSLDASTTPLPDIKEAGKLLQQHGAPLTQAEIAALNAPQPLAETPVHYLVPQSLSKIVPQEIFDRLPQDMKEVGIALARNGTNEQKFEWVTKTADYLLNKMDHPTRADKRAVALLWEEAVQLKGEALQLGTVEGKIACSNSAWCRKMGFLGREGRNASIIAFRSMIGAGTKLGNKIAAAVAKEFPEAVRDMRVRLPEIKAAYRIG